MWILRTVGQPSETTFRILPSSTKTIGRATGADFILDEALISRVHCRVEVNMSGDLDVTDLGSTNGTFVNGTRVTTARLVPGDRIKVGRLELIALKDQD
ncbi:MAG: FHA domain-containing protein [Vicinamibacterales bacterium]